MPDQQPTKPQIIEFNAELNGTAEEWIKAEAKKAGMLGGPTHDPVDQEGNLVDQRSIPVAPKFLIALNEQQAQDAKEQAYEYSKATLDRIKIKYGSFVDEKILRSPRTIFTGPNFPYHFAWFPDRKKYGTEELGARAMTDADNQYLDGMRYEGYRRANLKELERYYVVGESAVLLELPRHPMQLQTYRASGMPVPPPLPPHLRDKFGTVMPVTVRGEDGSLWIGSQCLYMIDRRQWDETNRVYSVNANGTRAGHAFDLARGVTLEPDSRSGVYEIPLDGNNGGPFS